MQPLMIALVVAAINFVIGVLFCRMLGIQVRLTRGLPKDGAKPYLGATLIYVQSQSEPARAGHRDHPCIVTRVWNEDCVNVKVFFDHDRIEDRTHQTFSSNHVKWPG